MKNHMRNFEVHGQQSGRQHQYCLVRVHQVWSESQLLSICLHLEHALFNTGRNLEAVLLLEVQDARGLH